jgi:hypothetical protein
MLHQVRYGRKSCGTLMWREPRAPVGGPLRQQSEQSLFAIQRSAGSCQLVLHEFRDARYRSLCLWHNAHKRCAGHSRCADTPRSPRDSRRRVCCRPSAPRLRGARRRRRPPMSVGGASGITVKRQWELINQNSFAGPRLRSSPRKKQTRWAPIRPVSPAGHPAGFALRGAIDHNAEKLNFAPESRRRPER